MGCDIHSYCEVFENGQWKLLSGELFDDPWSEQILTNSPYKMRNYALFGLLAGVRDSNVPCICGPRGVPPDASKQYRETVELWDVDGHSHSYFTLNELLAVDYSQKSERSGVLSSEQYRKLVIKKPEGWANDVGGIHVFLISNSEMDRFLEDPESFKRDKFEELLLEKIETMDDQNLTGSYVYKVFLDHVKQYLETGNGEFHLFTEATWTETIRESVGTWWFEKTLERLKTLAPNGDFNKIRMVFFFDN